MFRFLLLLSFGNFLDIFCRHFEVKNKDDPADAAKLFSVPDFVGDACKAIASRVRGAVAQVAFDDFHKVGISLASVIKKCNCHCWKANSCNPKFNLITASIIALMHLDYQVRMWTTIFI